MKKQYLFHIPVPFLHCPCTTLVAIIYNLYLLQITRAQSLPRGRCVLIDKCQDIVDRKMCHNIVDKLH